MLTDKEESKETPKKRRVFEGDTKNAIRLRLLRANLKAEDKAFYNYLAKTRVAEKRDQDPLAKKRAFKSEERIKQNLMQKNSVCVCKKHFVVWENDTAKTNKISIYSNKTTKNKTENLSTTTNYPNLIPKQEKFDSETE